jgi:Matrixin
MIVTPRALARDLAEWYSCGTMTGSRSFARFVQSAVIALSVVLMQGQAHAYCREVTGTVPPAYDPTDAGCFTTDPEAGVLPQLFWRNQCVQFNLNRSGSQYFALSDALSIATEAFTQWNTASCAGGGQPSILATEGPLVDCDDQSWGHNNPIIFRDMGWLHTDSANAIGYTTLTVNLDTGEILGAEIEINTENHVIVATSPAPDGAYDLPSILTHEAGHFLGLAHSQQSTAVMYAYYHPFYQANTNNLDADDVAGICSIYPNDGSRNTMAGSIQGTSCDTQPIAGFEDLCGSLDGGELPSTSVTQPSVDAGAGPLTENLFGCAIGYPGTRRAGVTSIPALVAWGLLARRLRRAPRLRGARRAKSTSRREARRQA